MYKEKEKWLLNGCSSDYEIEEMKKWIKKKGVETTYTVVSDLFGNDWGTVITDADVIENGKKYKKIEMNYGNTIDEAVHELIKYKEKGELAYSEFNGIRLFSDIVTIENAYLAVTGKKKSEREDELENYHINYKQEQDEFKKNLNVLEKEWMRKGKQVLTEDVWQIWSDIMPKSLNGIYQGLELEASLDIAQILNNNGTLEQAKEKMNSQNHSGTSFMLVCQIVRRVTKRGEEFATYVHVK